jgi:Fis family transcriptional regulator
MHALTRIRDTVLNSKPQTLEQSVVTALIQYLEDLDGEAPSNLYDKIMSEIEKPLLATVLQHCDHNQSRAASYLGINRGTLRKKLRQYRITP